MSQLHTMQGITAPWRTRPTSVGSSQSRKWLSRKKVAGYLSSVLQPRADQGSSFPVGNVFHFSVHFSLHPIISGHYLQKCPSFSAAFL